MEENHYYMGFGLKMEGISSRAAGSMENKYKYNGIEFNNDLDINIYEAYYRNLDPQIGRWFEVDPEIESMESWSPYASNFNNPILNKDFLGNKPEDCGCCPEQYLYQAAGQLTSALAKGIDNIASFFTKSETEISKPSSVTNASTVFTTKSQTDYGTNLFGWVQSTKSSNPSIAGKVSIFKADTKAEYKLELKQEVKNDLVKVESKTAINGSSEELKLESKIVIKKVPVTVSVSNSQDFQSGENKTKIKAGLGSKTNQAFGQIEISKQNSTTKTSVIIGLEEKTNNVKQTFSIGKAF